LACAPRARKGREKGALAGRAKRIL
jgi:hypothetical protein